MELTIKEIIDAFDYIKHVGNGEFEYKHCREEIALDEAVIIMRKYQRIQEIVKNTQQLCSYGSAFIDIREVIEDGKID